MPQYKIFVKEGPLKKELYVSNSSNERIWNLKSHDSILKKAINFHLRVKLPSVYFIHNNDKALYQYMKNSKRERVIIKNDENSKFNIDYSKHLGDKYFKWSNGEFELYSSYQTTVHIKKHQKIIGSIEFSQTNSNLKGTEDVIEIRIVEDIGKDIPIIILLYVNEFYQEQIGGRLY